jgi:hypothetical protein
MAVDRNLWQQIQAIMPTQKVRLPHLCGTVAGFKVMLVDGNKVKLRERKNAKSSHIGEGDFMDFVEGGNGQEDDELCAKDEAYIDGLIDPVSWPYICYHEVHEARDIKKFVAEGMSRSAAYEKAHKIANAGEKVLRQENR